MGVRGWTTKRVPSYLLHTPTCLPRRSHPDRVPERHFCGSQSHGGITGLPHREQGPRGCVARCARRLLGSRLCTPGWGPARVWGGFDRLRLPRHRGPSPPPWPRHVKIQDAHPRDTPSLPLPSPSCEPCIRPPAAQASSPHLPRQLPNWPHPSRGDQNTPGLHPVPRNDQCSKLKDRRLALSSEVPAGGLGGGLHGRGWGVLAPGVTQKQVREAAEPFLPRSPSRDVIRGGDTENTAVPRNPAQ